MSHHLFRTEDGLAIPAVTAMQMREVDRIAVEDFGLDILQMMENAGRSLALHAINMLGRAAGQVTILAGGGGNGGGGLCCARHLHNRGITVRLVLDRSASDLRGAAGRQLATLQAMGLFPLHAGQAAGSIRHADLVLDAIIGYSLRGEPRGKAADLIDLCNQSVSRILSLDVPSGLDATTGQVSGTVVRADRILTLALPKTGLYGVPGELYLADIGLPPEVYQQLGQDLDLPFDRAALSALKARCGGIFQDRYWIRIE